MSKRTHAAVKIGAPIAATAIAGPVGTLGYGAFEERHFIRKHLLKHHQRRRQPRAVEGQSVAEPIVALDNDARTTALVYAADAATRVGATLVLAHGAGAPQQSAFIVGFARGLASRGVDVVTLNFLYMQKRRVPDRAPALEACYRAVIGAARSEPALSGNAMFIGGKSMGGRIATHLAAEAGEDRALRGVIALGYPLHPPGKPDQLRTAHLPKIRVPMLIVQGERDTFGTPGELRPILDGLSADVTLHVVERGDHSLAPSKRADVIAAVYADVQDVIAGWIRLIIRS